MRYLARLAGQPAPDVLLIQLRNVPDRPVVRLHLPNPIGKLTYLVDLCDEHAVITDDPVGPHMAGDVELDGGTMLSAVGAP